MAAALFTGSAFKPKEHIPPMPGKVIVVTGGNTGLGKAQLQHYATNGSKAKLYMCARSKAKADEAIKDIQAVSPPGTQIHFVQMELADLASVRAAAETLIRDNERLDVLVNNAGIMMHPPELTKDGYEKHFGTNHMGHFLFTALLLPLMRQTAANPDNDVRIVTLSSEGHKQAPAAGVDLATVKTEMESVSSLARYGQSKLANHLFTVELARRYPALTPVTIHPGVVSTNLTQEWEGNNRLVSAVLLPVVRALVPDASQGSLNSTWATVADVEGRTGPGMGSSCKTKVLRGAYHTPVAKRGATSEHAKDAKMAKDLWEFSEKEMVEKGFLKAGDLD